jgi:two-component system, chemotaxis family, sensor kinase CheA
MDEVVQAFLEESEENLLQMEQELLQLEERPQDRALVANMFRTVHTIKGTCGFLGFARLGSLTHAGESLLATLRDGSLNATKDVTDQLLALLDAVRRSLEVIRSTGVESEEDFSGLTSRLVALAKGEVEKQAHPPPAQVEASFGAGTLSDSETAGASHGAETSVRVDVALLDRLLDLVGELVLARNELVQVGIPEEDQALTEAVRRIERCTDLLQADIMRTRMRPVDSVLQVAPRLVRELAQFAGKKVHLEVEGGETELDRGMLEAIRDPLVHLLRNAVDHGIESAEERARAGKPAEGHLKIRAYHQGGLVTVEISDDGAGIDPKRLRRRAAEIGLLSAAQADSFTDQQAVDLIFRPGFSTAREVTSVSGRGVGMDVVRVNVERVGGSVEVSSVPGAGTMVRLRIPLTLAIIPALLVEERGERYAIPQVNVQELLRLNDGDGGTRVEEVAGAPVFRLRGRLLPLVTLARVLAPDGQAPASGTVRQVVVLQTEGRLFGLAVENIQGVQEIVVKALGRPVNRIPVLAGATILGDGSVALILDAGGLAQRAGLSSQVRLVEEGGEHDRPLGARAEGRRLLVVRSPGGQHAVIPVECVERLEELPVVAVERLPGMEVVQYRGDILPIVRVSEETGGAAGAVAMTRPAGAGLQSMVVVVFDQSGQRMGLVVGDLVDIVEETPTLRDVGRRPGVVGSVVVQGRVAELVDIEAVVAEATGAMAVIREVDLAVAEVSPNPEPAPALDRT